MLTMRDREELANRANLDRPFDMQPGLDVNGDVGYIQIRSTGCLASVSWWTPTGRWTWVAAWQPVVERSIMSWQEGEGSDVLACPEGPAPVSLMRLPLTGDVVVRLCVCQRTCVGVDISQRLNKRLVSVTSTVEMSVILSSTSLSSSLSCLLRKITDAFVSIYIS